MKFEKKDAQSFNFGAIHAIAYAGMENLPADVSLITVKGRRGRSKSTKADRFFLVMEGKGKFIVADTNYEVVKEDVIFVLKETMFDYEGEMKLTEFSFPPYDQDAEVDLEL